MDLAAYLGSVGAVATVAVACMLAVVRTFGSRLDDITSGFNSRFDDMNRRFDDMNSGSNGRFDDVDRRFDELANGINRRLDDLRTDLGGRIDRIERRMDMAPGTALEPGRDG